MITEMKWCFHGVKVFVKLSVGSNSFIRALHQTHFAQYIPHMRL